MPHDSLPRDLLDTDGDAAVFAQTVDKIERESGGGNGEASALMATVEAVGAGRRQNWARAFDLLLLAAEQGWHPARQQLQLLARRQDEKWGALRAAIDLEALLATPEARSLCDSPRIRSAPRFATGDECRWLINAGSSKLRPAEVWNPDSGAHRLEDRRSNSTAEFRLFDLDVVIQILRSRAAALTKLPVVVFEVPQILRYTVGQYFKPHYDFFEPNEPGNREHLAEYGQRIATFLLYLNEDYEGGETEFPIVDIAYRGGAGDALFFANVDAGGAPEPKTLHAGVPPTSGEKWVFSQWIRNQIRNRL